jgi:hypothetical protein
MQWFIFAFKYKYPNNPIVYDEGQTFGLISYQFFNF